MHDAGWRSRPRSGLPLTRRRDRRSRPAAPSRSAAADGTPLSGALLRGLRSPVARRRARPHAGPHRRTIGTTLAERLRMPAPRCSRSICGATAVPAASAATLSAHGGRRASGARRGWTRVPACVRASMAAVGASLGANLAALAAADRADGARARAGVAVARLPRRPPRRERDEEDRRPPGVARGQHRRIRMRCARSRSWPRAAAHASSGSATRPRTARTSCPPIPTSLGALVDWLRRTLIF